jgi:hypothetical protein
MQHEVTRCASLPVIIIKLTAQRPFLQLLYAAPSHSACMNYQKIVSYQHQYQISTVRPLGQLGQFESAIADFQRVLELDQQSPRASGTLSSQQRLDRNRFLTDIITRSQVCKTTWSAGWGCVPFPKRRGPCAPKDSLFFLSFFQGPDQQRALAAARVQAEEEEEEEEEEDDDGP